MEMIKNALEASNTAPSDETTLSENGKKSNVTVKQRNKTSSPDKNFTLKLFKRYEISVYKPLIPLKILLFLWGGAAASLKAYLVVFLKQRGLTLEELTLLFSLTPLSQTLASVLAGIIADKTGRIKILLLITLALVIIFPGCTMLLPRIIAANCSSLVINLQCYGKRSESATLYNVTGNFPTSTCRVACPSSAVDLCYNKSLFCEVLDIENYEQSSFHLQRNASVLSGDVCFSDALFMNLRNLSFPISKIKNKTFCEAPCVTKENKYCIQSKSTILFALYFIIWLFFLGICSTVYRCLDIVTIASVSQHSTSFYGRERLWAVIGSLILPAVTGSIVHLTSFSHRKKNYGSAIYFFMILSLVTGVVCWIAEIQASKPSKKMWKKSLTLLKKPEMCASIPFLIVLGSCWGFKTIFRNLYLEKFEIPGYLLGLLSSMSYMYGMPFLFTSNWWTDKFGPANLINLAFLAYAIEFFGYSLLKEPWLSLLLETTSIVSLHLFWVAVIEESSKHCPEGLIATVTSVAASLHFALGRGSGSLIGGSIMVKFGDTIAFTVMGTMCVLTGTFCLLFRCSRYLYLKNGERRYNKCEMRELKSNENIKDVALEYEFQE